MKPHTRPNPPYTTKTGVQIGLLYQRPAPAMTRDDELLQTALLGSANKWATLRQVLLFLLEKGLVLIGGAIILALLLINTARAL